MHGVMVMRYQYHGVVTRRRLAVKSVIGNDALPNNNTRGTSIRSLSYDGHQYRCHQFHHYQQSFLSINGHTQGIAWK
jgi:hypothetical protein